MQTNLPWNSWRVPYTDRDPPVWFHDVFYEDGRSYRQAEINLIRRISLEKKADLEKVTVSGKNYDKVNRVGATNFLMEDIDRLN